MLNVLKNTMIKTSTKGGVMEEILDLVRQLDAVVNDCIERKLSYARLDVSVEVAILLYKVGDQRLKAGDMRSRGYYRGTNASYTLRKLEAEGYIQKPQSNTDLRSVEISLTEKGHEVAAIVEEILKKYSDAMENMFSGKEQAITSLQQTITFLRGIVC